MEKLFAVIDALNNFLLSVPMLVGLLLTGLIFTIWSGFSQYRSLTHGIALIRGKGGVDTTQGPGALTHFQALTAALSGTVGLGAIAGMAIAVELGGPGAIFWMWTIGIVGMALKSTEVTLALLYRDVSDPKNPHGGTMFVARNAIGGTAGKIIGTAFALSLLLFAFTGGNMFQTWSAADTTREYFGVPPWVSGLIIAVLAGTVIIGGITRIGNVTKTLVPFKCGVYVLCGLYVILQHASELPALMRLIFTSAFSATEGVGAFTGASFGMAFMFGMKRALFSSESGLGTAPIAHSAVKTPEPVTEGVVSGLEPFIDTIFVCTVTGLVILCTGLWNRPPALHFDVPPAIVKVSEGHWQPQPVVFKGSEQLKAGAPVFMVLATPEGRIRSYGTLATAPEVASDALKVNWRPVASSSRPDVAESGLFADYRGATLVAKSFDAEHEGLGRWLITIAVWVFSLSTLISYGYYAEQAVIFLGGAKHILPLRLLWCAAAALACAGWLETSEQLDAISTIGMGFMYAINLPMMLFLGHRAMRAWHDYFRRRALKLAQG
ncbi:MAG: amino acid carrier protein [Stagnimonas sp.]|nr:amino acid carrier protein [Stagnimonas sp.]